MRLLLLLQSTLIAQTSNESFFSHLARRKFLTLELFTSHFLIWQEDDYLELDPRSAALLKRPQGAETTVAPGRPCRAPSGSVTGGVTGGATGGVTGGEPGNASGAAAFSEISFDEFRHTQPGRVCSPMAASSMKKGKRNAANGTDGQVAPRTTAVQPAKKGTALSKADGTKGRRKPAHKVLQVQPPPMPAPPELEDSLSDSDSNAGGIWEEEDIWEDGITADSCGVASGSDGCQQGGRQDEIMAAAMATAAEEAAATATAAEEAAVTATAAEEAAATATAATAEKKGWGEGEYNERANEDDGCETEAGVGVVAATSPAKGKKLSPTADGGAGGEKACKKRKTSSIFYRRASSKVQRWLNPPKPTAGKKGPPRPAFGEFSDVLPPIVLDKLTVAKGLRHLSANDPRLARLIARVGTDAIAANVGTVHLPDDTRLFDVLLKSITFSLISVDAGNAILRKLARHVSISLDTLVAAGKYAEVELALDGAWRFHTSPMGAAKGEVPREEDRKSTEDLLHILRWQAHRPRPLAPTLHPIDAGNPQSELRIFYLEAIT